ncbi:hypothetical protein E2C01_059913 [Portunus trituberculatus]|uniref:Uncharacterized protein n=1 Tax=Portunus trituberculatus TaxID=210409 RepID=A0A5B7H927_PORTR|nr:hypothetical protein [Portunus trituberculatus]
MHLPPFNFPPFLHHLLFLTLSLLLIHHFHLLQHHYYHHLRLFPFVIGNAGDLRNNTSDLSTAPNTHTMTQNRTRSHLDPPAGTLVTQHAPPITPRLTDLTRPDLASTRPRIESL